MSYVGWIGNKADKNAVITEILLQQGVSCKVSALRSVSADSSGGSVLQDHHESRFVVRRGIQQRSWKGIESTQRECLHTTFILASSLSAHSRSAISRVEEVAVEKVRLLPSAGVFSELDPTSGDLCAYQ